MDLVEELPIIYTAHSKLSFFCRDAISEFVLREACVPLNPFRLFDYFLGDRVERDLVRRGNNNIVRTADELWVFGDISDGVLFEVEYATSLGKTVRYFTVETRAKEIRELDLEQVEFESDVLFSSGLTKDELREILRKSLSRK